MKYQFKTVCLTLTISLAACAASQPKIKMEELRNVREEVIESYPKERPEWMEQPPVSDGKYDYFVGHSVKFSTESAARDEAMSNAIKQFVRFCGVEVSILDEYLKVTTGRTSSVLAGVLSKREQEQQQAQAYVTSIRPKEWYLRRLRIFHDEIPIDTGWQASVVIMVPVEEKAKVQAYAKKVKREKQTIAPQDSPFFQKPKIKAKVGDIIYRKIGGLVEAQVQLTNQSTNSIAMEIKGKWYDEQGFEVADPKELWRYIIINGKETKTIRLLAPGKEAVKLEVLSREGKFEGNY